MEAHGWVAGIYQPRVQGLYSIWGLAGHRSAVTHVQQKKLERGERLPENLQEHSPVSLWSRLCRMIGKKDEENIYAGIVPFRMILEKDFVASSWT